MYMYWDISGISKAIRMILSISEKYEKSPHSSGLAAVGNKKSTKKTDTSWQMPDIQFLLK